MADLAEGVAGLSGLVESELSAGDALRAAEQHAAAAEEYRRLLEAKPDLSSEERCHLQWHLAWCLHEQGLNREAAVVLGEVRFQDVTPVWAARVDALAGWVQFQLGNIDQCIQLCESARESLAPTAHHDELCRVLRWLAFAWREKGDVGRARDFARDALSAARRTDDAGQLSRTLSALGFFCAQEGRLVEAHDHYESALTIEERRGDLKAATVKRLHLGVVCLYLGRLGIAQDRLGTSLRSFEQLGSKKAVANAHIALARLARRRGELEKARAHADAALAGAEALSFDRGVALAREELGDLALETGDSAAAVTHLGLGLSIADRVAPEGDLAYELSWRLASSLLRRGEDDRALELVERAIRLSERQSDVRELGNSLLVRAELAARAGRLSDARADARRAEEHFRRIGAPYELASAHRALARILAREPARKGEARAHLHDARRLYEQMELPEAAAAVDREILGLDGKRSTDSSARTSELNSAAFARIVTRDPGMLETIALAQRLAELDVTILLEGETGTGKELFARAIHDAGPRADEPFVAVNCAAVPKDLLEGELFGHTKGAFTGALRSRRGHLTRAGRGTVFLDEIDKSSRDFQTRLLRVLEDREVWPVGADASEPLEAAILCATNATTRDLREGGHFLPDLYYRLAEFTLRIAPLREREGDVALLAERFLQELGRRFRTAPSGFTDAALESLSGHSWPGNVRELRNALVTAVLNAGDGKAIDVRHLPVEVLLKESGTEPGGRLNDRIERIEREAILSALNAAGGVKATAARMLGVSRKGLRDRLRRLGLE